MYGGEGCRGKRKVAVSGREGEAGQGSEDYPVVPLLQQRAHVVDDVRAAGLPHDGCYCMSEGSLAGDAGVLGSCPEEGEDWTLPGGRWPG
jgi:hypothetical protein